MTDDDQTKTCARPACAQPFTRRPNEHADKFRMRQYCSPRCRVASNTQPVPRKREVAVDRPSGFTNPDGVWRPAGFPVYPGGIEIEGAS